MNAKQGTRLKVVYIAGWGRSGSTLVSNILGQLPGLFSFGEIRYLWQRGLVEDGLCGCGQRISNCEAWKNITAIEFGQRSVSEFQDIAELCYQESRHLNLVPMFFSLHTHLLPKRLRHWVSILGDLYAALGEFTGNAVIVDSSKSPIYAAALKLIPCLDVHILHLIRDPRPVAYSWTKPKGNLDIHSPLFTALMWNLWNLALEDLRCLEPTRYYLMRYEDFVVNPRRTIRQLLNELDIPIDELPFRDNDRIKLKPTHNVSGNPNRFESGLIKIQPDLRWRRDMPAAEKLLVTIATWPFLLRYRYPLYA